ncbi:MAG: putative quinol monooxygenase [Pseudomonadota bacterium]
MVIVWGCIEIKQGSLQEAIAISLEHVERSKQEAGCLNHSVQQDVENPQKLVFYEEWEDLAVLQQHFAVPESGLFVGRISQLAVAPPTMKIFEASEVQQ